MSITRSATGTVIPRSAPRNVALVAARVLAALTGAAGLAGMTFFMLIAPEEAVWVGPWLDVPVVALLFTGLVLKLAAGLLPGLPEARRIRLGIVAASIGVAVTLVKIPAYDEPEGVVHLALDSVLLLLLLLARRGAAPLDGAPRTRRDRG